MSDWAARVLGVRTGSALTDRELLEVRAEIGWVSLAAFAQAAAKVIDPDAPRVTVLLIGLLFGVLALLLMTRMLLRWADLAHAVPPRTVLLVAFASGLVLTEALFEIKSGVAGTITLAAALFFALLAFEVRGGRMLKLDLVTLSMVVMLCVLTAGGLAHVALAAVPVTEDAIALFPSSVAAIGGVVIGAAMATTRRRDEHRKKSPTWRAPGSRRLWMLVTVAYFAAALGFAYARKHGWATRWGSVAATVAVSVIVLLPLCLLLRTERLSLSHQGAARHVAALPVVTTFLGTLNGLVVVYVFGQQGELKLIDPPRLSIVVEAVTGLALGLGVVLAFAVLGSPGVIRAFSQLEQNASS